MSGNSAEDGGVGGVTLLTIAIWVMAHEVIKGHPHAPR